MNRRQRLGYGLTRKGDLAWLGWPGALAVVVAGLSASTCGVSDSTLDRCSETNNCGHLPGTVCVDPLCMCPVHGEQYCDGACRPLAECLPDGGNGAAGAGGAGGTNGAGGSAGKCGEASECPQPGDPHCGRATCTDGVCGLALQPFSELASQVRGDCKNLWCDGAGNLIAIKDASDPYNDGKQCTVDVCLEGESKSNPASNASTCPETGAGVCYEGSCVACIDNVTFCGSGLTCDGVRCVPMHCVNDFWDQGSGETAQNCGGPCRPCSSGQACKVNPDCLHGVCLGTSCAPPTCKDGVLNGNETSWDCGGSCPACQ